MDEALRGTQEAALDRDDPTRALLVGEQVKVLLDKAEQSAKHAGLTPEEVEQAIREVRNKT